MRNFIVLLALFFSGFSAAATSLNERLSPEIRQAVFEEKRSAQFERAILKLDFKIEFSGSQTLRCFMPESCVSDYELFVTVLSNLYNDQKIKKVDVENWFDWLSEKNNLTEADVIHFVWTFKNELTEEWSQIFADLHQLAESQQYQLNFIVPKIKYIIQEELEYLTLVPTDPNRLAMARDLISVNPDISKYKNGAFKSALRLFMFCRDDRRFPCLMVMKDGQGRLYRKANGKVWSHQLLAYSRHTKKYNETNGNTPAGVYTIDGVMPVANRKDEFGEWRRLIMNFIPRSDNEASLKSLLPASSRSAFWWQETAIARDMGRNAFRIHGTQQPAPRGEPYFPFYGTSGCIANRENTYDGVTYREQRTLLDVLMRQLKMDPVYANETKIKALLYVINIDNAQKWVSLEDLQTLKIIKK
jgi:hypothetical protein